MSEQLMNISQFAERLNISERQVYRLLKSRIVKPVRIGRRVLFREHHVSDAANRLDTSKKAKD